MTKDRLKKELLNGKRLNELFDFTDGQECLIYKGNFTENTLADEIVYIPDIYLNDIDINKVYDDKTEIERIISECFDAADFIRICKYHTSIAFDLFNLVDWQHPDLQDLLDSYYSDEDEFLKRYKIPISFFME